MLNINYFFKKKYCTHDLFK